MAAGRPESQILGLWTNVDWKRPADLRARDTVPHCSSGKQATAFRFCPSFWFFMSEKLDPVDLDLGICDHVLELSVHGYKFLKLFCIRKLKILHFRLCHGAFVCGCPVLSRGSLGQARTRASWSIRWAVARWNASSWGTPSPSFRSGYFYWVDTRFSTNVQGFGWVLRSMGLKWCRQDQGASRV